MRTKSCMLSGAGGGATCGSSFSTDSSWGLGGEAASCGSGGLAVGSLGFSAVLDSGVGMPSGTLEPDACGWAFGAEGGEDEGAGGRGCAAAASAGF